MELIFCEKYPNLIPEATATRTGKKCVYQRANQYILNIYVVKEVRKAMLLHCKAYGICAPLKNLASITISEQEHFIDKIFILDPQYTDAME